VRLIATPSVAAEPVGVVRVARVGEVAEVVRALESSEPVLVDLSGLDSALRQRVFDMVSGIAYALDAKIARVREQPFRFVVTPNTTSSPKSLA
jgi:FtsZ-interacting cell division protein YlmF